MAAAALLTRSRPLPLLLLPPLLLLLLLLLRAGRVRADSKVRRGPLIWAQLRGEPGARGRCG